MRRAAGELDHVEAALDVAMRVGDHLAVLRREQMREFLLMSLDHRLEIEQDARAALRIERCPRGLRGSRRGHCSLEIRSEEHTSELQSLMRNAYDVFCLNKK